MTRDRLLTFLFLAIPVLALLLWLDLRNTNIGFIQLYSIDEFAFHGSILHMYQGLTTGNLSSLFGFGFYQYGFAYFALNLLVALPGLASDSSSFALVAPRIITSLFAVASLAVVYLFACRRLGRVESLLAASFIATMTAFWFNATWFHPDWPMTFFLLLSVYFFDRDEKSFGQNFWIGIATYGLAIAFKYQAVTFLPLICLYIFSDDLRSMDLRRFRRGVMTLGKCLAVITAIFILLNPYILHPMGWKAFSGAFISNMNSNATNHGSVDVPSLTDKVSDAIGSYYLHPTLFVGLVLTSLWIAASIFRKRAGSSINPIIAATFLINLTYLLFFVNKAWQTYYLPVITIGLLPMLSFLPRDLKAKRYVLVGALILQIAFSSAQYVPLLTESRDRLTPDFNTYSASENFAMNNFIIRSLEGKVVSDSVVLITPYTPFEYERLGLTYDRIKTIYGPITADVIDVGAYVVAQQLYWGDAKPFGELAASFKPVDFIVLRKDIPFIDTSKIADVYDKEAYRAAAKIAEKIFDGSLGYTLVAEDERVAIFSAIK